MNETQETNNDGRDRKKALYQKLLELSEDLVTDTKAMDEFAQRWRGGFHSYSFQNLILIWVQKHDSKLCAGFHQWKKHGRHVKAGEKAIWILAPYFIKEQRQVKNSEDGSVEDLVEEKILKTFISVPVFDVSQTEGKPLAIGNIQVNGNSEITTEKLKEIFPYPVSISNGLEDGLTDGKKISVSERDNQAQMVCAYLHELAHILLDHQGDRGKKLDRQTKEIEAESTAYLVSSCLGIDNQGARFYISSWGGNKNNLKNSSLKIISTSEKILRKINPGRFKSIVEVKKEEEQQLALSLC